MVLGQIIRGHEMVEFEKRLKPHQLAKLPKILEFSDEEEEADSRMMKEPRERVRLKKGPENVFDRAVMQHNLLSVSRIYNRISFKGLGRLVGLTSTAVEIMARTMIQENRLKASIDQVEKLITFKNFIDSSEDDVVVSNVAAAASGNDNLEHKLSEKDQLVAIAPSLFVWDESVRIPILLSSPLKTQITSFPLKLHMLFCPTIQIRKTLQKVETVYQHINDLKAET
jgi:COP9 signalosome complex subunit 4